MGNKNDWGNDRWDDAPDFIRERMQKRKRRITGINLLNAIGVICLSVVTWQVFKSNLLHPQTQPVATEQVSQPPAEPSYSSRVSEDLEPVRPTSTALVPPSPQPLNDCIKDGNVIDESVVRCRYGELPVAQEDPAEQAEPQGMVSAAYLENFKANRQQSSSSTGNSRSVEYDSFWVDKWSGGGSYLAEWTVVSNYIDGTSVCGNHRRGSIDYRECRKGAKQFFKQQCREWSSSWDSNHDDHSKTMQRRYCSAANSFSPMG